MLTDKIRAAILLHRELGVDYFQLLRKYFKKDKIITIYIKNLPVTMDISKALLFNVTLRNIKEHGWSIADIINDILVFEDKQKSIKLYSSIDDNYPYSDVIYDIFVREFYKADFANKVVIDVGAYRGESSIYFAMNGAKRVIALEPDEVNYSLALINIKENNLENKITLLNKALAPKEGVINFYRYYNLPGASSTDPNSMVKFDDKIIVKQVEAITLNQILKIVDERIGLLKLDCEGCEYSVLNSFSDFDMIDNIILEYHNGAQNLPSLLKDHGFEVSIEKATGILRAFKK